MAYCFVWEAPELSVEGGHNFPIGGFGESLECLSADIAEASELQDEPRCYRIVWRIIDRNEVILVRIPVTVNGQSVPS